MLVYNTSASIMIRKQDVFSDILDRFLSTWVVSWIKDGSFDTKRLMIKIIVSVKDPFSDIIGLARVM